MKVKLLSEEEYVFKILLLGDAGVGKSKLLAWFIDKNSPIPYLPTVSTHFKSVSLNILDKSVRLNVWDSGG